VGHLDDDTGPLFPRGFSIHVKAVLLIALSLGLMFIDTRYELLQPARAALATATAPVEMAASLPDTASSTAHYFASREALMRQNEALRREQLLLQARLQKLIALESENRRIRALLKSSRNLEDRILIAEILAVSNDPYRQYLKLNKGTQQGVFVGQALVDAQGIMGQIVDVGLHDSSALLITDPNHGIPVEVSRNGLRTIAHGTGGSPGLNLPYLPSNADVQLGDTLYSSGLGGRFPAGYPVGKITEIKHHPGEHFLTIAAVPAAHMDRGREVLLVWHDAAAAQAEPAAPAPPSTSATPAAKKPSRRP
jgi:rod shape-determining protein MreC